MRIRGLAGVLALTVAIGLPAAAAAAAQEPQSQFVPADTLPQETLPATPLVFAAYAFAWVALAGYVFSLWRKLARVERELEAVRRRMPGGSR